MDQSAPIRVGLLGYGFAGKTFHAPLIDAVAALALFAVASSDAAKVHADFPDVRVHADPLALIADDAIDLVVIATPNDTHAPLARAAIAAGKHVVVDKPFTLDLDEARDLASRAEAAGVLLSVFHNRRFDSDFLTVRQAIEDGRIGAVSHFESHFDRFRPAVRDRWREQGGPGSGIWFDLGPHLVDQAVQLFGTPDRILASLAAQRHGARSDDWAHVLLFYGQRRVVLHAGMLVAGGSHRFVAHGGRGSLVKHAADRQEQQLLQGFRPGAPDWGRDDDPLIVFDAEGGERSFPGVPGDQRRYYAAIADALTRGAPNPVPPRDALLVMAIIEAAVRSSETGRVVDLALE